MSFLSLMENYPILTLRSLLCNTAADDLAVPGCKNSCELPSLGANNPYFAKELLMILQSLGAKLVVNCRP